MSCWVRPGEHDSQFSRAVSLILSLMKRANVHDAKTHFSDYLEQVEAGEVVLICRRNVPVAELRPIVRRPKEPRPLGLAKGSVKLGPAFFEPLPKSIEEAFIS